MSSSGSNFLITWYTTAKRWYKFCFTFYISVQHRFVSSSWIYFDVYPDPYKVIFIKTVHLIIISKTEKIKSGKTRIYYVVFSSTESFLRSNKDQLCFCFVFRILTFFRNYIDVEIPWSRFFLRQRKRNCKKIWL